MTGFYEVRDITFPFNDVSSGRPPVVRYPRLLIQSNRSCLPPPAGRLCRPQPEGQPYRTDNSRHLIQRRSLWNVVPLCPQMYTRTHTHTHTHTLQSLAKC